MHAHGPCTGMGNCGGLSPLLPRHTPCQPQRCHIMVEHGISMGLFLRVALMAPGGKPVFPSTGGKRVVPLGPEAQDRPAFSSDSFLRVVHAPLP